MKYKFYPEQNLLVDVCTGIMTYDNMKELFLQEIANPDFKSVHKILSNIIDSDLAITVEEIEEFAKFMSSPGENPQARWAILTDKPDQVSFSLLLKKTPFFKNIIGIFSTIKACSDFLDISFSMENFKENDYIIFKKNP